MKTVMLSLIIGILGVIFGGAAAQAGGPPAGYPIVKGIVRKIDAAQGRIILKHDEIPNLNMPGMTMSFPVKNAAELAALAIGDNVNFAADEVDGEATVIWIEKAAPIAVAKATVFCTGYADTTPRTKIELEVRVGKFSTIRYEFVEGSYAGTAYVNSMGRLTLQKQNGFFVYEAGVDADDTRLELTVDKEKIVSSRFSHMNSGLKNAPMECRFET